MNPQQCFSLLNNTLASPRQTQPDQDEAVLYETASGQAV